MRDQETNYQSPILSFCLDAHDSDEEIFEKTTIPAVEVFNMSTVDCQASANSQDDEEAGIIDKAERRLMKFPCPPGPTQAAESNESNKLHNNNNYSFQDGGKTTDPRSLLEGKLQVGIQLLALIMVKQIMHFVIKGVFLSANPKTDF